MLWSFSPSGIIGPYDYKKFTYRQCHYRLYRRQEDAVLFWRRLTTLWTCETWADGLIRAWKYGEKGQGYIISGSRVRLDEILDEVEANYRQKKLKRRKVNVAFVKIGAFFAPLYYAIRGKKPLFSKYSVDVLMSKFRYIVTSRPKRSWGMSLVPSKKPYAIWWAGSRESKLRKR